MSSNRNKWSLVIDGIIKNNPTFVLVLGMCPTLCWSLPLLPTTSLFRSLRV